MFSRQVGATLAAAFVVAAVGCGGGTYYNVGVNSFTKSQEDSLTTGASVAAVSATGNALFADEVEAKAEQILAEQGFEIAPPEKADYLVFLAYGIGPPKEVSEGGVAVPIGNIMAYVPQSRTEYFRWLAVGAAEAAPLHEDDFSAEDLEWLWMAETTSTGSGSDLRRVVDYLLVPTLERFGDDTGERVEIRVEGDDPRVQALADSVSR